MVWNIQYQVAGLIIVILILIFSYSRERLEFKTEKAFLSVLWNVFVCILFDILSVAAINLKGYIGATMCELVCEIFLLTVISVGCHATWFAIKELRFRNVKYFSIITGAVIVLTIVVAAMFETKTYLDVTKNEIYMHGITVVASFVICMIYILGSLITTMVNRNRINRRSRITIYSWLCIWIIAGTIQRINQSSLIIGFSLSLTCLVLYCNLENPEYNMDSTFGIFNQNGFHTKIEELLADGAKKSIVSFSITNMGVINEVFGISTVNKLIMNICRFAQQAEGCTAFRLDDYLFCLLVDEPMKTESVLEYVVAGFEDAWEVDGGHISVTVTTSYIDNITEYKSIDDIIEVLHYFASDGKKRPGEVIAINAKEIERKRKRMNMQQTLAWALKNKGVEVFYQPIYNIEKGIFTSMEALVRIRDEEGNLIFPNDFIEYAEKNGMILELGEQIFRNVCEFIQRSHIEKYGVEFIDVNLSVVQCMQDDLARTFKNIMGEYQIAPHRISLEITETAAIATKKSLDRNMEELIDYGVNFSLDDYGSGYSNLSYIVGLPVSIIKLDREITIAYAKSEKARVATENTIRMIHELGMEIIVEGIETQEQYMDFKSLGAEMIQGYYFSKPLSKENVLTFLQSWM